MPFPIVEFSGGRVVPFSSAHATQRYVDWLNDPVVVRYSEQRHRRHTLESCRAYLDSFTGSPDKFLAIEADDDTLGHIGNISVAVDVANRVGDISIMVGERLAWGRGLGGRAWCAVVEQLLAGGWLRKVTAGTMAANAPMLALLERSGMSIEGRRPRQFLLDGTEVDLVLAGRFARAPA